MNILLPRTYGLMALNAAWACLRKTWVEPFIQHSKQMPLAVDIANTVAKAKRFVAPGVPFENLAHGLLAAGPLRGAGSGWESYRWLQAAAGEGTPLDCTGSNSLNYNVLDFWEVHNLGHFWTTAGSATALVLDFDLYPRPNGGGTLVADKLDGTNGYLQAPTAAGQTIGSLLYKLLSDAVGPIAITPGQSIKANVTTTVTSGAGLPIIIGCPRAWDYGNLSITKTVSL
jgi:hypothetical protein